MMLLPIARLILGIVLLFVGRAAFWFFTGAVGFLAGAAYAPRLVPGAAPLTILAVAIAAGVVGAVLAVVLRTAAIVLAGFYVGGHAALALAPRLGIRGEASPAVIFLVGGIVVAVLLLAVLGWALIVVTSILGAWLVVGSFTLSASTRDLAIAGLAIVGILVQGVAHTRRKRPVF